MRRYDHGTRPCARCGGACDARATHCADCTRWAPVPAGYLSIEQAAERWGVTASAVKMRIARGTLPSQMIDGRRVIAAR